MMYTDILKTVWLPLQVTNKEWHQNSFLCKKKKALQCLMFTTVEEILQTECTKVPNDYKRVRQQNLLLARGGGGGGGERNWPLLQCHIRSYSQIIRWSKVDHSLKSKPAHNGHSADFNSNTWSKVDHSLKSKPAHNGHSADFNSNTCKLVVHRRNINSTMEQAV